MSRLGQGDLRFRNYGVGTVWVSRVAADVALQPRIALSAGCQVQDLLANEEFPEGVVGFTIAALGGQLRWQAETGPVVGDLSIPKGLQHFRSTNHAYEHTFTMCCDAPHDVLSRLEAERGRRTPGLLDGPGGFVGDRWNHPTHLPKPLAVRSAHGHVGRVPVGFRL